MKGRSHEGREVRDSTPVRTARFMAGRVLALVEHPVTRRPPRDGEPVTALRPTA